MESTEHGTAGDSLPEDSEISLGVQTSTRRGGRRSRARRLEKYKEAQANRMAQELPPTPGVLCRDRANLRDGAHSACSHLQSARAKIRRATWTAWTHRYLTFQGPPNYSEFFGSLLPPRGAALEPLSNRDMWLLGRAVMLAKHLPKIYRRAEDERYGPQRHVLDWLRVGSESGPHWEHTQNAMFGTLEISDSECDDGSEYTSDQDDPYGDIRDCPYLCPWVPRRSHPSAWWCHCARNEGAVSEGMKND